ncbi:MAG: DUF2281 domain-containing protein [Candidatus Cloacimonadota bacterium]|nr:DUF2281 domain-containing protein [Candidatus Cloacimonadota bacterium]
MKGKNKMDANSIESKLNSLPDNLKREVLDFINFLITKKMHETIPAQFDFTWEGGLSDIKDQYSSVELQHQSTEWR